MKITEAQLKAVMPGAKPENVKKYITSFNKYFDEFGISTPLRVAHFLAQVAHESGQMSHVVENLNYSMSGLRSVFPKYFKTNDIASQYARNPQKIANRVYANRMGNGSEASGDGWKYRGRGMIQITGKEQYEAYKTYCGYDVVSNPDLLSGTVGAVRSAMWWWKMHGCNELADSDAFTSITRRINGGTNGLEDRRKYLTRAKSIFK